MSLEIIDSAELRALAKSNGAMQSALEQIRDIKSMFPRDRSAAATECVRIARQALDLVAKYDAESSAKDGGPDLGRDSGLLRLVGRARASIGKRTEPPGPAEREHGSPLQDQTGGQQLGRRAIGIELNPEYAAMARKRIDRTLDTIHKKAI